MKPEFYMQRALDLANKAYGKTWPNPMVGAVIVKNGKIIGEGFHEKSGLPHAEVRAIENSTESCSGATIYINLEPCCHTKKLTPPCAQRLMTEGFKKVVISNLDPNPAVSGKGVALLREHGIEVEVGVLEDEGEKLNEVFFLSQRKSRPFIHLKMASSLDGKIALSNGESKWITGEKARTHVHELRSAHQAIMVGAETVRKDNPKLNVRLPDFSGDQPYRIIISKSCNLPQEAFVLSDELKDRTLIYSSIETALEDLFHKKIINILLEGGPTLAGSMMKKNLIDRVSLYLNPSFIGEGLNSLQDFKLQELNLRPKLSSLNSFWLGEDLYLTGKLGG
jgi:diaminohydroxyphosphoribosylaminopyrimidine deaminase / 5-amino-6-(5-phosphoribosylamino)uracil reductase